MKTRLILVVIIVAAVVSIPLWLKSRPGGPDPRPAAATATAATRELPRFVDLGSTTCAPCKVMLGVMGELERRYPGEMVVEFIDVTKNPDMADRYGIQIIPSQIFYGPDGRELFRHTGVIQADAIVAKWAELGFHFASAAGR